MEAELWWFIGTVTCLKVLLHPSYRSTDYDVHRHWLALTSSLPPSKWYTDESSPHTLDYPPLFAAFEYLLSLPASLLVPSAVDLRPPKPSSAVDPVVLFQRSTVALSDLLLFLGVHLSTRKMAEIGRRRVVYLLIVWSPALLMVDHVHFQYNGFLLGILLVSLACLEKGRDLMGGFIFAALICFKHLFAVAAPVYFVYLLRHYCRGGLKRGLLRFVAMGVVVGVVFAASFGPFLYYGQMQQVLRRLFPFGRGLCHAYWAPNFWVFYIIIDKVVAFLLAKLGFSVTESAASFTGGLVGESSTFSVLPQVTPIVTFLLVMVAISPCLWKAWRNPQPKHIIRWVAYAYTCGFLFGWHVHEKASLHFVIPLGLVAINSLEDARHYFVLSIVSCYSLFPLLFESQEYPIKVLLLVTHSTLMWMGFNSLHFRKETNLKRSDENRLIGWVGMMYLLGMLIVEIWGQFLHPFILGDRLPFLPLMLVSVYCAIGMMYSWIWQLRWIIKSN
ncbi:putative dolichyl pyrophosphate Glc1Man9GlcNAc2 alpha-1,3-glucosyltransferase [Acorus calamus]|uniref:Alpha-1,3-glucosyltransferase n=1 Tax=Acorus calamus TaxID=4465 RepID=A0AAV9E0E0_ACOCL|nr:putative dolichyl pyrophosphate Glc1Man9GlcNAc2 alpha-1,3-glucosyltransferase [Acorus calamus]